MTTQDISLHDKYDLQKETVLLNGTQALVRLVMMQAARDKAAGLDTAGYVTGYRGSPLGAVDMQMTRAKPELEAAGVLFQPGLNEDLAATAIWGTQQAELRGEGKHDGVFALWYGKGPGVDRSGDPMRHANMAGTSVHGGVLMAMGDDHTGESSTVCHQSDWALIDAYMPILSPAGVQEILDYGLYGYALSRYSGLWAGLKLMKDTVEVTSVVDGRLDRVSFVEPTDFEMPEGGLNIRLADHWIPQEERITDFKRFAAEAFSHANKIDKRVWGKPGAKIGFVAAGKNWLDLVHALGLLGVDAEEAERLGITTYKIGQTFPLDMKGFHDWAEGLDLIIVVEEKRKIIEVQIKEAIFDDRRGRRVYGWRKGAPHEEELFPVRYTLDPAMIAEKIGDILIEEGRGTDGVKAGLEKVRAARNVDNAPDIAARLPYYCSGCPHNTSTKVPEGSRAYAGIGCHTMALWMDRETSGFTHMGAEGANWIGESQFSNRDHVFQNLGDGTYNHSGLLAIRAALAAKNVNITYKILYNDAVAMTGGQTHDGGLPPEQIAQELLAAGVKDLAVVFDPKEEPERSLFPKEVTWHDRAEMPEVQRKMAATKGVSAIIYVQTCAAEKRRRRKRGEFPDPDKRVFINTDICEGCGDCGVQSNCVSIVPVETELGRKRAIDQSSCNKDYSCLDGFCPSFVTVEGAKPRKAATVEIDTSGLPEPEVPEITGLTHNIVITGVGGTGVVTIGAVLAMAAHLDDKGAGVMEMAGLAQKGGAVHIHCRIGKKPSDISAIRVAVGEADTVIGGDLVVTAGSKTTDLMVTGRTKAVVNTKEIITGDFTRDTEFRIPGEQLQVSLQAKLQDGVALFDSSTLADKVLGDAIYSNMIVLGASWQLGQVPISREALARAIELNGAKVAENLRAFDIGRWAVENAEQVEKIVSSEVVELPKSLDERIAFRADHLVKYQSERLAKRYRKLVDKFSDDVVLKEAVAKGYHKLLAYKDEFEVARMLLETRSKAEEAFDGDLKLTYHLAPPLWARTGPSGRPAKKAYSIGMERFFPVLAKMKSLRGTPFNPFGYSTERRLERRLIRQYERDMATVLKSSGKNPDAAVALAELPLQIRGFGPVKEANATAAAKRRDELLAALRSGAQPQQAAE